MSRGPMKFILSFLGILAVACSFVVWYELHSFRFERSSIAAKGTLRLTNAPHTPYEVFPLSGQWAFYPNQLLTPSQISARETNLRQQYLTVPQIWGQGYGTYALHVQLNKTQESQLNAIYVPSIASSYRFWINGQLVRTSGKVGTNRLTTVAQDRPGLVMLSHPATNLNIVVEVSNFVQLKGGIGEPVLLGNIDTLIRLHDLELFLELFIVGSLFIIGLYYVSFYIRRRRDTYSLYFALLCLDVAMQALLLNSSNLLALVPSVGWILQTRAEYLSESFLIILFIMVTKSLYPSDSSRVLTRLFVTAGTVFSALFIVTPPWVFTYSLTALSMMATLVLVYTLSVFIRAIFMKRENAWIHLISLMFFAAASVNDILYYLNLIHTGNLIPEGLYVFVLVQNLVASQRHATALSDLEKRTEELMQANTGLETRIRERTKELEATMEQLRQSNQMLTELSTHDMLTTIFNRSYFDTTMPVLWKNVSDIGGSIVILLIDIDFFKEYNDTYGHVQGDACLREVATAISDQLTHHTGAFIARYGGEEFAAVVPDVDPMSISDIGNSLHETVLNLHIPHASSSIHDSVSISVGGVGMPANPTVSWTTVVKMADDALYKAKRQGRNQVVIHQSPELVSTEPRL